MSRYELVKDSPALIRDGKNQALLNRDYKSLQEYKMKKNIQNEQKNQIVEVQDDINTLKNELKEIKDMFKQILNKI